MMKNGKKLLANLCAALALILALGACNAPNSSANGSGQGSTGGLQVKDSSSSSEEDSVSASESDSSSAEPITWYQPTITLTKTSETECTVSVKTKNSGLRVWFDSEEMVVYGNSFSRQNIPVGWTVYACSVEGEEQGEVRAHFITKEFTLATMIEDFAEEVPENFSNLTKAPDGSTKKIVNSTVSHAKEYSVDNGQYINGDAAGCVKIEKNLADTYWRGWYYEFATPLQKGSVKMIGIRFLEEWWELTYGYLGVTTNAGNYGGVKNGFFNYCYYQNNGIQLYDLKSFKDERQDGKDWLAEGWFHCMNRSMILWIDAEAFFAEHSNLTEITGVYMGMQKVNVYYIDSIFYI